LPYLLSMGTAAVALAFALRLPPAHPKPKKVTLTFSSSLGSDFRAAVRVLGASPVLMLVMAQGVAIFVLDRISQVNLFQPILKDKAFALGVFGLVSSGTAVFEALGSARAPRLRRLLP